MKQERTWPALVTLCLLAAVIPESIASFNTPVRAYIFAPPTLVFLAFAYGSAAILIREAMVRLRLGWTSIILLGVAYAAVNEGIVAATWFRMKPDGFQFIQSVDWLWVVALSIFHACCSMVVPISLTHILFPGLANRPWLRARGIKIAVVALLLLIVVGLLQHTYRAQKLPIVLYVAVLAYCGLALPPVRPRRRTAKPSPSIRRLRVAGFLGYLGFFVAMYAVPAVLRHADDGAMIQVVDIVVLLAYSGGALFLLRRWTARAGWADQQTLALLTGPAICAALLSVLPAFLAALQPLLTLPFLGFLLWKARRLRRAPQITMAGLAGPA